MSHRQDGGRWIIDAGDARLVFDPVQLTWSFRKGKAVWETLPPAGDALRCTGESAVAFSPAEARERRVEAVSNGVLEGVTCHLSRFEPIQGQVSLELTLWVAMEPATGDVVIRLDGRDQGVVFRHLLWPGPMRLLDPHTVETIIPFMQGALVPGDWPGDVRNKYHECNSRGLYMPWWAQRDGQAGYLAILETDADAGCWFDHPAGGPTAICPWWRGSLDRIAYHRRLRYSFFEHCSYVSICKQYRRYVQRQGRFVTLQEKIAGCPKVSRLVGSPVIHAGICHHIHPESHYYRRDDPARNDHCVSFQTRAAQLRALRQQGVSAAYLHLDGWGVQGYDSHHPDYLPPNQEAGGWEGFRRLAETCQELGYLFALHDQYRDYYRNAPSFSEWNAVHDAAGAVPGHAIWYGGPQAFLCAQLAPEYVLRNHLSLKEHGVPVDGTYLDVFAIVPPDECFHSAHRMSRKECIDARVRSFGIIRDLEGIASSEEPVDFAIPHLHLVHHGPYATEPWMTGLAGDLPRVPLFNLVYHDSILLPWDSRPTQGGWGIPAADCPIAHAALNAGMPYLNMEPDTGELERVARLCALHRKLALEEMVGHEFLSADRTHQRTLFANGVSVTANLSSGQWDFATPSL